MPPWRARRFSASPALRKALVGVACACLLQLRCLPAYAALRNGVDAAVGRRGPLLAGCASAAGLVGSSAPASAAGLDTLFLAWQKLGEGKNPLEAIAPGTRRRLRAIAKDLDALQEDVFARRWETVAKYKPVLLKYKPLFVDYVDNVYPGTSPVAGASRIAMRYEISKFFSALDGLDQAAKGEDGDTLDQGFAGMSLAFDRYVKAGDLYEGQDPIVSTAIFYEGIPSSSALKYISPASDPPLIKDRVLLIAGPDKGKTGVMIGREFGKDAKDEKPVNAYIKFDGGIGTGGDKLQEVKLVPYSLVAKQVTS